MPNLLIRDVPKAVVDRLKARAAAQGRSLQEELRRVVEAAAPDMAAFRAVAARIRRETAGRVQTDSVELIREDRDR